MINKIFVAFTLSICLISCSRKYNLDQTSISVMTLGAKGDGISDDTKAIQHAMILAGEEGKSVFFPEGTYIISKSNKRKGNFIALLAVSSVDLIGVDPTKSIIKLGPGHRGFDRMLNVLEQSSIHIMNLGFDGNIASQERQEEHQGGIWINSGKDIKISNCHFYNTGGDGIGIRGPKVSSDNILVKHCKFYSNGRNGITLGSGFKNILIDSCFFDATEMHASPIDSEPHIGECKNATISNNIVVNKSISATLVTLGGHVNAYNFKVFNNKLENCGLHLVRAHDVEIFSNNIIIDKEKIPGIRLLYSNTNVIIDSNIIKTYADGVAILTTKSSAPKNVSVINNKISIKDSDSKAIKIQGVKDINIVGNSLLNQSVGPSSNAIYVRATRDVANITMIDNNISGFETALKVLEYQKYTMENILFKSNVVELNDMGKVIHHNIKYNKSRLDFSEIEKLNTIKYRP